MRGVQGGLTQGPRVCKVQRALAVYGHTAGALHISNKYTQTAHQCTRQHAHKPHVSRKPMHTSDIPHKPHRQHMQASTSPHTTHNYTHPGSTQAAHQYTRQTRAQTGDTYNARPHPHTVSSPHTPSPTCTLIHTHTLIHTTSLDTQSHNDATACTTANPATGTKMVPVNMHWAHTRGNSYTWTGKGA